MSIVVYMFFEKKSGIEQGSARQTHDLEVVGSNPASTGD
jgi:hypothetical protein